VETDVAFLAGSEPWALAILRNGDVRGWGNMGWLNKSICCTPSYIKAIPSNIRGVTRVVAGGTGFIQIQIDNGTVFYHGLGGIPQQSNVKLVATAYELALFLYTDGTVGGWGRNWGTGSESDGKNLLVGMEQVELVAAGAWNWRSYFLHTNGTLTWRVPPAQLWYAECRGPDVELPTTGMKRIKSIVGSTYGCQYLAIVEGGTLIMWGSNSSGQSAVPSDLAGRVVEASGGYKHTVALLTDGSIRMWGDNTYGQTTLPSSLIGANVSKIEAGPYFTVVMLAETGKLVAWGRNDEGQLDVPADLAVV
jgi:hypothetical protein